MVPVIAAITLMVYVFTSAVLVVTVFPLFFWVSIVPEIEKRVGQKLQFKSSYNWLWPIGKYIFGYVEATRIITLMYLNLKIFKGNLNIKYDKNAAIVIAKYDVSKASKKEIVFSLFCSFIKITILISLLGMFLIPRMFPLK